MIAIIMPCRNSGKHLSAAIDSILNNTEYPFKLIIIDGESTDGTGELVDDYAGTDDRVEVHHIKNQGYITAMNYGIEKAGDLDVYMTQDDVILPNLYGRDWLKTIVDISKSENCGIVTTINAGGRSGPDYIDGFNWIGTWSLFIPRSTINKIGVFDEAFSPGCGDDIDFTYRVVKAGLGVFVADFWVDHHRTTQHLNDSEDIKREHALYFKSKYGIK